MRTIDEPTARFPDDKMPPADTPWRAARFGVTPTPGRAAG
jgi:hypothetical protein